MPQQPITLPVEMGVDDHRLGHRVGVVGGIHLEVIVGCAACDVGQHVAGVPLQVTVDRLGVGVDEQLVGVEAVPLVRGVGPVHPVSVALAGRDTRDVAMPLERGLMAQLELGLGRRPRRTGTARPPRRSRRTARSSCRPRPRSHRGETGRPARCSCRDRTGQSQQFCDWHSRYSARSRTPSPPPSVQAARVIRMMRGFVALCTRRRVDTRHRSVTRDDVAGWQSSLTLRFSGYRQEAPIRIPTTEHPR